MTGALNQDALDQLFNDARTHNGWLDERKAVLESLLCLKRAGANAILSYFSLVAARWLAE